MKNKEQLWEDFEDGIQYDLGIGVNLEYQSEQIIVTDEWGTEKQIDVYDVRMSFDLGADFEPFAKVNIPLQKDFKSTLMQTLSIYLTEIRQADENSY